MKSCIANFCRARRLFRIEIRRKRPVASSNSLGRSLRAHVLIRGQRFAVLLSESIDSNWCDRMCTTMALTLFLFMIANKDYLVSLLISACILPLFFVLLKRSLKEVFLPVDKPNDKIVSCQLNKKKSRQESMCRTENKKMASRSTKKSKDLSPTLNQSGAVDKSLKKLPPRKRKNRSGLISKYYNQENIDAQMEDRSKSEGGTLEEADKSRGRNKKNRNHSPPPKTTQNYVPFKVKYYSPLSIFKNLDLQSYELYDRFSRYVLDSKQLKENGYPYETAPGKADFWHDARFRPPEDSDERICSRCKEKFIVTKDGHYSSDTMCHYHTGKRLPLGDIYNAGAFSCCGNPITSNGCQVSKQHVSAYGSLKNVKFIKTREKRNATASTYCIYALDCEMCYTIQGLEVTRVSVVGTDGLTVYDSYIVPDNPIIDYNTEFSGVTPNHLKNVSTTLTDAQAYLMRLLTSNTILVGHGLENDLKSLHIIHDNIVDTAVIFSDNVHGKPRKLSLKTLSSQFLHRTIQNQYGHDSVEDARTCIELMLMKIQKETPPPSRPTQSYIPTMSTIPSQQWQQFPPPPPPISINPVMVPYTNVFFVPPVGSSCDFF